MMVSLTNVNFALSATVVVFVFPIFRFNSKTKKFIVKFVMFSAELLNVSLSLFDLKSACCGLLRSFCSFFKAFYKPLLPFHYYKTFKYLQIF